MSSLKCDRRTTDRRPPVQDQYIFPDRERHVIHLGCQELTKNNLRTCQELGKTLRIFYSGILDQSFEQLRTLITNYQGSKDLKN